MEKEALLNRITIGVIVILLIAFYYFVFVLEEDCVDRECFDRNMKTCSKANYVNEEEEAIWGYKIRGEEDGKCEIEVTLFVATSGPLGLDDLEGRRMSCFYPLGAVALPEKELDKCRGYLKEGLQEKMIDQLHKFVVGNLEEIKTELVG